MPAKTMNPSTLVRQRNEKPRKHQRTHPWIGRKIHIVGAWYSIQIAPLTPTLLGNTATKPRRSLRANKGEGGALAQLTNVANAIRKPSTAPQRKVVDIPASLQTNPMAPVNTKPTRGRGKQHKQPPNVSMISISCFRFRSDMNHYY